MDLSENGKCLFTSMQYVESSHAPYQRIRFFLPISTFHYFLKSYNMFGAKKSVFHGALSAEHWKKYVSTLA
jgi:hypothetical protein